MQTWNNLIDKIDLLLRKVRLDSTVQIAEKNFSGDHGLRINRSVYPHMGLFGNRG